MSATKDIIAATTKLTYKFNPGFQSDVEAIDNFVVRKAEFQSIVATIGANACATGDHNILITAPRGAGKTTLVRRVLAEVRTNADINRYWHPIFLAEESYTVTTPGEFFLECLFHLQDEVGEPRWRIAYSDAKSQRDEVALARSALSVLREFARDRRKRLLLIVENLHMILNDQMGGKPNVLGEMLREASIFMVLATSVREVADEEDYQATFFSGYNTIPLKPLDLSECQELWEALTHKNVSRERIRPLQILTGGSPRLMRIMAEFTDTPSLQNLMGNLNLLIDQNTEYFKSQLDGLPPAERKIFAALLDIWDPTTAKEVADSARVNVNIASAMLARLADRGSVIKLPGKGRSASYYAAERLFNIYYLMRRRSHPSSRVRALVAFMTQYYRGDELIDTTAKLVAEACGLAPLLRQEYHSAFSVIIAQSSGEIREKILSQTPEDFLSPIANSEEFRFAISALRDVERPPQQSSGPTGLRASKRKPYTSQGSLSPPLLRKIRSAMSKKNYDLAEAILREAIAADTTNGDLWRRLTLVLSAKGAASEVVVSAARQAVAVGSNDSLSNAILGFMLFHNEGDANEIERCLVTSLAIDPKNIIALSTLGDVNHKIGEIDKALDYYQRAWAEAPDAEWVLCNMVSIMGPHLGQHKEVEILLRDALKKHPKWPKARADLARCLISQDRPTEAEVTLREGVEIDETSPERWVELGRFLFFSQRKHDESRNALERAIHLGADRPAIWSTYAQVLQKVGGAQDAAIEAARKAVDLKPDSESAWLVLGRIYADIGNIGEAEAAFRRAVELDEDSARGWYGLGMFLQDLDGRLTDAEVALRRAVASSEDYPCAVPKELAALLIHKGADEDARPYLEQALAISGKCYCSLTLLAGIATRRQEPEEARRYFERALEVRPKGITAMTGLAQLLIEHDSDLRAAESIIGKAMAANSLDSRVFLARALLRRSQQATQDCLEDLRRALDIDPDFAEAKLILALVEAQEGEAASAISHLRDVMGWLNRRRELLTGVVDAAVALVRRGYGPSIVEAIQEAEAQDLLEPLCVALEIVQGKTPLVAKEIFEVASDIVGRIKRLHSGS